MAEFRRSFLVMREEFIRRREEFLLTSVLYFSSSYSIGYNGYYQKLRRVH